MRILIHVALFAMLAGFLIPSIDGCCCSLNIFKACGKHSCNFFGCNCDTTCYKGRCGYCYKCSLKLEVGGGSISANLGTESGIGISFDFDLGRQRVPLHDGNLECCGSGCRRRRRSLQDMILVSSFIFL